VDQEYQKTVSNFGIDVKSLPRDRTADLIKSRSICTQLTAGLDHWARVKWAMKPQDKGWKTLVELAALADDDPVRNKVRDALIHEKNLGDLDDLVDPKQLARLPAPTLVLLADLLVRRGKLSEAVALLEQAEHGHSGDFRVNYQLASYYARLKPPQLQQAARFYKAAQQIRKDSPGVHFQLGRALVENGEFEAAGRALEKAREMSPRDSSWAVVVEERVVTACQRLVEIDLRLRRIRDGKAKDGDLPANANERIDFAQVCTRKQWYAAAAQYYLDAFEDQGPAAERLKQKHLHTAACIAVLASTGQGKDEAALEVEKRQVWHGQARQWLRSLMTRWDKELAQAKGNREERARLWWQLGQWWDDYRLEAVRVPAKLQQLPETERDEWLKLGQEIGHRAGKRPPR
jgi:tetratricopeptide (TPR) repeat protein